MLCHYIVQNIIVTWYPLKKTRTPNIDTERALYLKLMCSRGTDEQFSVITTLSEGQSVRSSLYRKELSYALPGAS